MKKNNKLLFEVFRQSNEANFQKFLDNITSEDGVIDSKILFEYKKEFDKKMEEALERVNNIGKPVKKRD